MKSESNISVERKVWIDLLRGFCMMAILYFHTEMYYAETDVTPYVCYVDNVLSAFFFLSGYLMYNGRPIDIRRKMKGILRHLVLPYFLFTTLFVIPKAFVHAQMDELATMFLEILTGEASWFITALIVCETLWVFLIKTFENRSSLFIAASGMLFLLLAILFGNMESSMYNEYDYWHINEAMLAGFFMSVGYMYHINEPRLALSERSLGIVSPAIFLLIICKYIILTEDMKMVFGPIIVSCFPLFIVDNLLAIFLMVSIFKRLPDIRFMSWTGRRSILFYFVCGGFPLLVGKLFRMIGLDYTGYLSMIPVYIIVYILSSLFVMIVNLCSSVRRNSLRNL